ncbi:nuclease-related domain-containing protein [Fredinandcohnia sp. 179-A 10B2 NHS]|uniref:nuclease-related domain-containing protein n=1 Tax=Fredinandcohnia sp. 179-A 10B2 NHS TaxID=3235176 RepID=UPI0039A02879
MIYKPLIESKELILLRIINNRMNTSAKEKQYYYNLEKGFEGEKLFAASIEKLSNDRIIIHDLLLEYNNTLFQIDTLLIAQTHIYLFEVKNFEGDYYLEGDKLLTFSEIEVKNPLLQLQRSASLLRQLLQKAGITLPIEANVVFVNPEFTLYQTPKNVPVIFPTQLTKFLEKIEKNPSKLNQKHHNLAKKLVAMHITDSPFSNLPAYTYDGLKKGMTCLGCGGVFCNLNRINLICKKCGCCETVDSAVLRNIEEFRLLFPERKLTTNVVYDWCGGIGPKKQIKRILATNFKQIGDKRFTYYVKE